MDKIPESFPPVNAPAKPLRRKLLVRGCTLLALPVIPSLAHAATILAVRTWPAEEYTRVTLEMDSELKAEHFTVENPNRLVVDIDGLSMSRAIGDLVSKIKPNDPYIRSVRVGQNRPNVVRLVFDLKQAVAPQVFTLKPIGEYKYRLVLDLYPKVAQDPLMALLKDSQNDPLAGILDSLAQNNPNQAPIPSVRGQQLPPMAREKPAEPPVPPLGGRQNQPILIAIDPGHGGEDPGATGQRGTHEKDIVLQIAFRLKKLINAQPNMRAYMTRDRDYFVPLGVRVQKARRVKADLFISIHADAFINSTARGSSVWALSQHGATSAAARWLAKNENDADLIGGVDLGAHNRQVAEVLLDLSTSQQINDSIKVGTRVLQEIGKINDLHKNHIERAGFAVLKAPDIPSILVETAFISNSREEALLRTPAHQQKIASAILGGVQEYFAKNPALARRA
ncbi:MAG: N-acetylmuramoyl-L-alanine amidase [Castellaniella sp.]|uniref:N-acetylmuramoyl-L-alanine amidase n=1 Tax=Castellaniella sp. TaxID=1955812 RepID=UPI00121A7E49|nr:N-acetylmuramoyl-L-alanine amidase [Castellaniella sp.]TAN30064.1 MAG: N-acetylmuramoyl-L-alanine amidase [Castellaniella sp.]